MMDQDINADVEDIAVSFCIPVYNTALYIEECLDSILNISAFTYEIIAIDDCSSDNSLSVLEQYKEKCNITHNITVLKNEMNSGVSFTRNRMINLARGKYIAFVDSDDIILSTCYERMYDIIERENADKISGEYLKFYSASTSIDDKSGIDITTYQKYDNFHPYTPATICGGFIKRMSINRDRIRFNEKVSISEDVLFNYEFSNHENVVIHFDGVVYQYRQLPHSLVNGRRSEERKKQIYLSQYETMMTYREYCQADIKDFESTKIKYLYSRQNAIYFLIRISDRKYIREQFSKLRAEGYYPFPFIPRIFKANEPLWKRICLFLLPIQPFALLLNIFMKRMGR